MNPRSVLLIISLGLANSTALAAAPAPTETTTAPRWHPLNDRQRQALRAGMRNFRAMSPKQRQQLRQSMQSLRRLPPAEKQRLRALWQSLTPEQRRAWLKAGGPGIAPPPRVN